jgi:hypothetical protein
MWSWGKSTAEKEGPVIACRFFSVLTALVLTIGPAVADMGPPPGTKFAEAVFRIESREPLPNFVAVVVYNCMRFDRESKTENWSEDTFVDLTPNQPIVLRGKRDKLFRYETFDLLIVRRADAKLYSTASKLATAIRDKQIPTAAALRLYPRETVPVWGGDEPVFSYRIERTPDSDGLVIVRTSWNPIAQCWVIGICVPAAILLGGLWLIRRFWRRRHR